MRVLAGRAPGLLRKLPQTRAVMIVLGVIALIVVLILFRHHLPVWAWLLILLAVAVGALTWALVWGIPWYRQRRFLKVHDGVVADEASEPARALERRLQSASEILLQSPSLAAGRDPLYRLPWYLVLSPDDATAHGFLRPPLADSPFPEPDPVGEHTWSWWFYKGRRSNEGLVAIQMPGGFVCEPQQTEIRAVWYQALRLLDRHRPKLPLNGLVLLLDARMLMAPGQDLREACTRLRRLADEALRLLRIEAPVYLVVGGCEALPGFEAFARALPEEARQRVLGERFSEREDPEGAMRGWLDRGFDDLRGQLHAVRLGLMRRLKDTAERRQVFAFVEAFAGLKDGLAQATTVLFEDNPYQRRPWLGGIFFVGADAFFGDLFGRFLPADQPLARKARRARLVSWSVALTAGALLLVGSVFLATTIFTSSRDLTQLIAAAEEACAIDRTHAAGVVAALGLCRERIEALAAARSDWPVDLGFGRAARAEAALKKRFVDHFVATVVQPLGRAFDEALERGRFGFAAHRGLARWWALVDGCVEDAGGCATSEPAPVFAGPVAGSLAIMTGAEARERSACLQRTALRWQSTESLTRRRLAIADRLRRAHERHPLDVAEAAAWAGSGPGIELARFWDRGPGDEAAVPKVSAAFSRSVWQDIVVALAEDLEVSPVAPAGVEFREGYGRTYADAWRRFLVRFIEGALAWQDDIDGLITRLADTASPYHRLWETLDDDLFPLAERPELPAWPAALAASIEARWPEVEPKLRSLFFELAEDPEGRAAYQLAAAIYGAGPASSDPRLETFAEIRSALEAPPDDASLSVEGLQAWRVIRQPLELWLRLVNRRAGAFLNRQWQAQVVVPSRDVPAAEREAFLFGPNGRVASFRADWLAPFLADGDAGTGPLGVPPPLAPEAATFIDNAGREGEAEEGPIYAGQLRLPTPARFGAGGEGTTSFTLSCLDRTQSASSTPGEAELSLTWSPANCFEVRLEAALPASLREAEPDLPDSPLVRTYPGPEGFVDFIEEFRGGSRTYALDQWSMSQTSRGILANHGITSVAVSVDLNLSEPMRRQLEGTSAIRLPERIDASPLGALAK